MTIQIFSFPQNDIERFVLSQCSTIISDSTGERQLPDTDPMSVCNQGPHDSHILLEHLWQQHQVKLLI